MSPPGFLSSPTQLLCFLIFIFMLFPMQINTVNKHLSGHMCVESVTHVQSKRRESFSYSRTVLNEVLVTMEKMDLCPITKNEACSNLIQQQHALMSSSMPACHFENWGSLMRILIHFFRLYTRVLKGLCIRQIKEAMTTRGAYFHQPTVFQAS